MNYRGGTPLARRTPLRRRTALRRAQRRVSGAIRPKTPSRGLTRLSRRPRPLIRRPASPAYLAFRADFLLAHPVCQMPGCLAEARDIHHRRLRSKRGPLMDADNCAALCRTHHRWVHDHPALAREQSWILGWGKQT